MSVLVACHACLNRSARRVGSALAPRGDAARAQRTGEQVPAEQDAMSSVVLKAVCEYDHGRYRATKTVETRERKKRKKRKERKERGSHEPHAVKPARAGHERGAAARQDVPDEREQKDEADAGCAESDVEDDATELEHVIASRQVTLEELVMHAKSSKRKAGDFEVVPKVRSVIALDDHVAAAPEVDEPWEYIALEDEHNPAPSYAQVVAAAA